MIGALNVGARGHEKDVTKTGTKTAIESLIETNPSVGNDLAALGRNEKGHEAPRGKIEIDLGALDEKIRTDLVVLHEKRKTTIGLEALLGKIKTATELEALHEKIKIGHVVHLEKKRTDRGALADEIANVVAHVAQRNEMAKKKNQRAGENMMTRKSQRAKKMKMLKWRRMSLKNLKMWK